MNRSIDLSAFRLRNHTTEKILGLFALAAIVVAAYWPSFSSMITLWSSDGYRHGYLVPLISAYLLFRQRVQFSETAWSYSWVGLFFLIASILLWVSAKIALVQALEHLAVILILNSFILTVVGIPAYRTVSFALGFLVFALPIGASIVPVLMRITADIASVGLHWFGVPVFREGMLMTLPNGVFEVADVCSGLRYLNAGLALGTLVAYFTFRSMLRRIVYVILVALVFIFSNGVRALIVMAVASATHMQHFVGQDHVLFGNVLFVVVFVGLIWLAERFSDNDKAEMPHAP